MRCVLHDQRQQPGTDQTRIEPRERFIGEDAIGHLRRGCRCETVDADIVLLTFQCERLHQPHQRHLRRAIVGLAKVSVESGG